MRERLRRFSPGWTMLAGLGLGGILTHFASEFFGMGEAAKASLFTPRHIYLGVIALVCFATLAVRASRFVGTAENTCDLRRRLTNKRESLPLRGRGSFVVLTAGLQFAAGLGSAVGEGCLFCGHDVAAALAGALLTAVILALVLRLLAVRLPSLAHDVCLFLTAARGQDRLCYDPPGLADAVNPAGLTYWSAQVANRPPPHASFAPAA
jgi:hypothetical protein